MSQIILKWLLNAIMLLVVAYIVPGFTITSFYTALILVILLALVNITLKPILLILTLPINILTLGLFTFVVNGFILWILSTIVKGFYISNIWSAIFAAAIISIFNFLIHRFKYQNNFNNPKYQ